MNQAIGGNDTTAAAARSGSIQNSTNVVPTIMSTSVTKSVSVSAKNEQIRSVSELMRLIAFGEPLPNVRVTTKQAAVTTVVAATGYPDRPRSGDRIDLPAAGDDVLVFHAGTKRASDGSLVTSGGRVLAVTGLGASLEDAQRASQSAAHAIEFDGKQFRSDIAWRELGRLNNAGAS